MTHPDRRYIISSITIQADGTAIEYLRPDGDVFVSGLQHQHVIFIPRGADYDDELDAIEDAAEAALADALQDTQTLDAVPLNRLEFIDPDEDEEEQ